MLADIGTLSGEAAKHVEDWVKKGGVLVRFAGSRLENGGDELLPVPLRVGGRTLGGALSWSTPQKLAPIEDTSLFAGTPVPPEVTVSRQVLADPAMLGPDVHVWARLQDGTPLVTERKFGEGQIILFHVTANSDWSNLPLSGLFVEMLRRISALGSGVADGGGDRRRQRGRRAGRADACCRRCRRSTASASWRRRRRRRSRSAPPRCATSCRASIIRRATTAPAARRVPSTFSAPRARSRRCPRCRPAPSASTTKAKAPNPLKSWLLLGGAGAAVRRHHRRHPAAGGRLRACGARTRRGAAHAATRLGRHRRRRAVDRRARCPARSPPTTPPPTPGAVSTQAADERAIEATSKVTLGYVLTGDQNVDEISRLGLDGLGRLLAVRTAVEPGRPMGVDILTDEIAFYPGALLAGAARRQGAARGDAGQDRRLHEAGRPHHLRHAGLWPRPHRRRRAPGGGESALQRILGKLDVPRLEPVPENHVLTKAFYLLRNFPGRWDGGQLWVEALEGAAQDQARRARVSDGVTSIIVTPNDLAAAWALDEGGRPLYPTVGGGEDQREMAFRTGINIVMHALTGNYKADQVHVPALLERLGQ